jgi:AraC-like DNA-binding protein
MPADQFTSELRSVCGSYDFDIEPERKKIWGGVQQRQLKDWDIALVATDMNRALKTPHNIKRDQSENIFLILQQSGTSRMRQNGRDLRLTTGDLVMIDSALPSEFIFSGERSMQISLHLPRKDMVERFGSKIEGGCALHSTSLTSRAIHSILCQVCNETADDSKTALQREVLYGLLGMFFMESGAQTQPFEPGSDQLVLARADAVIDRDFRDPALSGERIAHEIGVSLRSLQRAFNGRNETLTQVLLSRRLEFAKNLLVSPDRAPQLTTISSIAFESGFSDISNFNRRFRAAYGCSPRAFIHEHSRGQVANMAVQGQETNRS